MTKHIKQKTEIYRYSVFSIILLQTLNHLFYFLLNTFKYSKTRQKHQRAEEAIKGSKGGK